MQSELHCISPLLRSVIDRERSPWTLDAALMETLFGVYAEGRSLEQIGDQLSAK